MKNVKLGDVLHNGSKIIGSVTLLNPLKEQFYKVLKICTELVEYSCWEIILKSRIITLYRIQKTQISSDLLKLF